MKTVLCVLCLLLAACLAWAMTPTQAGEITLPVYATVADATAPAPKVPATAGEGEEGGRHGPIAKLVAKVRERREARAEAGRGPVCKLIARIRPRRGR